MHYIMINYIQILQGKAYVTMSHPEAMAYDDINQASVYYVVAARCLQHLGPDLDLLLHWFPLRVVALH